MGVSRLVNTAGRGFVVQQSCERGNTSAFTLKAFANSVNLPTFFSQSKEEYQLRGGKVFPLDRNFSAHPIARYNEKDESTLLTDLSSLLGMSARLPN